MKRLFLPTFSLVIAAACWPYLSGPAPGEDGIWPDDTGDSENDDTSESDPVDPSDSSSPDSDSDPVDSSSPDSDSDPVDSSVPDSDSDPVDTSDTSDTSVDTDPPIGDEPPDYDTWFGRIPASLVTFSNPYTFDAGVSAVRAAAPPTGSPELTGLSLVIDGAVVINTGGPAEKNIWVQDRNGAMRTFGDNSDPGWFTGVNVGDKVRFTVTNLFTYRGEPEITGVTGVTVLSSNHPVYVREGTGADLQYAVHGLQNIRLYGTLTASNGACGGGYTCFELTHGDQVWEARMRDTMSPVVGMRVHYVGPLAIFDGVLRAPTDTVDWYRAY